MSQVITQAFAQYWQQCLIEQTPVVLDEFVLANIPNLDPELPIPADTGLPAASQIVHRHPVDQRGRINNDAVAYSIVMDTSVGDFTFNAMYLINRASGLVAMAVHKGPETKLKTQDATGKTGNSLVKTVLMEYDQAATATATHVDASTWQIDFAARLRGMDDDLRLQALQFFGPGTFYGDGFKLVNDAGVYKVQPGVAYVGGLRAELGEVRKMDLASSAKPVGLWLDIYRAGSLLNAWVNQVTLTLSVPELHDYQDEHQHPHYVAKIATINADGSVTDVRRKRRIRLVGDASGEGILEDAQGVDINVTVANDSHTHTVSTIEGLGGVLAGKAEAMHAHPGSAITPWPLGSSEHLDNITTPGFYVQHANANTATERGYPEAQAGSLVVTEGAGPKQVYHVYNSSRIYSRARYGVGSWTPWAREYNTLNKPTAAELGAASDNHSHSSTANVAVLTGTIGHGGTIPLPDGYSQEQCRWMVGPGSNTRNTSHSGNSWRVYADANRVVTALDQSSAIEWATYLIIGVR